MNNFGKNLALWVIIALLLVVLFNLFQPGLAQHRRRSLAFSDFLSEVQSAAGCATSSSRANRLRPASPTAAPSRPIRRMIPRWSQRLTDKGVRIIAKPDDSMSTRCCGSCSPGSRCCC